MVQQDISEMKQDNNSLLAKEQGKMRHGGTLPSALMLSKAAIGSGVLSMAGHSAQVGFVFTGVGLVISGILTIISIRMLGDVSMRIKKWSFEDVTEDLYHWSLAALTGFVNAVNCLGSATAYLIVCGQVAQALFQVSETVRKIVITCAALFIALPLALAPHVNFMRYLASASICALIFLVISVVYVLSRDGVHDTVTSEAFFGGSGNDYNKFTVGLYVNSLNNIVFAYNNQFNVPQITGELNPKTLNRVTYMGVISTILSFTMYLMVSCFGVLTFGTEQKDTLVVDLAPERKNPVVWIALMAVAYSVLTCLEFHIYPIRQFLAYFIRKARNMDVDAEDVVWYGKPVARWLDIVCAVGSVLMALLVALALQSITKLIDIIGGFASGFISYVVPPLWIFAIRQREEGSIMARPGEFALCVCIFLLGWFFVIYGTYNAIIE